MKLVTNSSNRSVEHCNRNDLSGAMRRAPGRGIIALSATILLSASIAHADVALPGIFSDHMMLQRDARVPVWGWAEPGEQVIEGKKVIVPSPEVESPKAVRYAWAGNPKCNLVNAAGLPASPFRTDDWK